MGTGTGSIDLSTLNNLHTNLTQHFWFNSNAGAAYGTGVHMTLSSQAEFIANPTGQNILMNTDGISIRNGTVPLMILDNDSLDFNIVTDLTQGTYSNVATFGATVRIGAQDGYQTVITEGSSSIVSPENVELFSIRPSGNPSSETVLFREYPEGENVTSITLTHTPIPESKIDVYFRKSGGGQMLRLFTAGHSGTAAVYNSEISYDGESTITINNAEGDTYRIEYVMYNYLSPSIDLGALTIGTRKAETNIGNGSATIGRELTAEYPYQVVVGVGNRNFADSLFEVGNGNVTTKKTAFRVKNNGSICEGSGYTTASGDYSHAEGYSTSASGNYSHSEGYYTEATGFYSHAEGFYTDATNNYSHAEGHYTESSNYASHAEGYYTKASGLYSHSEGYYTIAASNHSHAEGSHTIASSDYQHVEGKYNIKDANSKYAHIIGNGTSDDDRSNAFAVDWDGNTKVQGKYYANCSSNSEGTAYIGQVFNWQGNLKANLTANADAYVEGNGSITLKGGHTYLVLVYVSMTNSTNGTVNRRAQIFNKTANSAVLTGDKFVASQVWGTVEVQTIYEAYENVTLTVRGSASRPTTAIPTAWIRAVCIA